MGLALEFHPIGSSIAGALASVAWNSETFDFWAFDRMVDERFACGEPLHVIANADEMPVMSRQLAIRTQRLSTRRNANTRTHWFTGLLLEHRLAHDVSKPLVLADLDHALDAWQWTLRLDPEASATVQVAALLHDIERLTSESDARIEHLAPDYQAFKDTHAVVGRRLAGRLLCRAGAPALVAEQACELIAHHERAGASRDMMTLNDADVLSFFSLNSPGYLAYFGAEQTAKKVAYSYARLSAAARPWLDALRMPAFVREEVARCAS